MLTLLVIELILEITALVMLIYSFIKFISIEVRVNGFEIPDKDTYRNHLKSFEKLRIAIWVSAVSFCLALVLSLYKDIALNGNPAGSFVNIMKYFSVLLANFFAILFVKCTRINIGRYKDMFEEAENEPGPKGGDDYGKNETP